MSTSLFDTLTTHAVDLQKLLQDNQITSVQIVQKYFEQIQNLNHHLNALISIRPWDAVLEDASKLDSERRSGHQRSPLHGVPIILKDNIVTGPDLGVPTTVGSWLFAESRAKKNSDLAQRLIDSGLIILGKANLTEFCGLKGTNITPGWSSFKGQTVSPYVGKLEDGESLLGHSSPGGSSTGSAVAVAAGLAPLAIGTETVGSVITPAARAALYAIKPTVGSVSVDGVFTLSPFFDSPGPMAKCPLDLASPLEILLGRSLEPSWLERNQFSIGLVDPASWITDEPMCHHHAGTREDMLTKYAACVSLMREQRNWTVKYPIVLPDLVELQVDGEDAIMPVAFWDFKNISIPQFLDNFDQCPANSLDDITTYNENNKERALPASHPNQDDLLKSANNSDQEERIIKLKEESRKQARQKIGDVFARENVEVIAAPADSPLCVYAAIAGYPIATVPLGILNYNGRPFGLCLMAKEHQEERLLGFMKAYETVTSPRPLPTFFNQSG